MARSSRARCRTGHKGDTGAEARAGRERRRTLLLGCGGDAGARGNPADAARPIRADTSEWLRAIRRLTCLGHPSVTGLENGLMAVLDDRDSPGHADMRAKGDIGGFRPTGRRHGFD